MEAVLLKQFEFLIKSDNCGGLQDTNKEYFLYALSNYTFLK